MIKNFKQSWLEDFWHNGMLPKNRRPVQPGEIIRHEYMKPLNLTQQQLADALCITTVRINQIIAGKTSITPDTAFRLAKYFNTTPDFWINLQMNVDMWDTLQLHILKINITNRK